MVLFIIIVFLTEMFVLSSWTAESCEFCFLLSEKQEPVDEARRRHHRSDDDNNDARAQGIPQQIQESVNAVMQAMRQLLADPFAAQPPVDNADNPDLEENEREWEDEQWELIYTHQCDLVS